MRTKLCVLSLILFVAVAHGISQAWLVGSVDGIKAENARLGRAASLALRASGKPVETAWGRTSNSIWLPALNSLIWGLALTGLAGAGLAGARKCGVFLRREETLPERFSRMSGTLMKYHIYVPVVTLFFASVVSVSLVVGRVFYTGNLRHSFLVWNLFLAWMPLLFTLLAREHFIKAGHRNWRFAALAVAWLLFFPNAPYIFTDVIHLMRSGTHRFWVDLTLILNCALTGFVVGFVSLYLMQSLVARIYGSIWSWVFIAAVAGLSGFGVYLGRIVRLNSWDIVARPGKLYHGLNTWAADPLASLNTSAFPALFALFLFIAYVILYALTHLQPAQNIGEPANATPVEA